MSDCLFCKIIAGEIPADIVYEDDKILVFKDIYPKADVHLLMVPKLHIESLAKLDQSHNDLMGYMMLKLPGLANDQGLTGGFRTIINTGKGSGQIIFHLHIHLLGGKNLPGF
ncbi:MAG: histidine triad nucleotide-binding protein [gamma proteobacterium symbiont of Lucinoma myriamae]|nr:histidine triad nucleotide-binding protein [gamma proteobacterium symbiont of Lucinoma myriamae]MCU7817820.1 histidine triad nucleotide-binding protein [gamma proteobacterium symbiont of Lucinoma myriamae]MCU7832186.1 histidine triad nucleotide-binding protein [gamma proteobacterium symbiont of Lucinoma myriamae]NOQ80165.1 HIT domain-containing protein [Gammaproteobacteria bacterium]